MENIKVGDKLKIYCYKHDGSLEHTSDEAVVLENNDEYLVCGNGRTRITEKDGRSHMTSEPAVLFFYKKHWFNVIGQLKKFGLFYYCNIASPYIVDDKSIKYIDYDLDLRIFPSGEFKILDKLEYLYHKRIMNYGDDLDKVINNGLDELINYYKDKAIMFDSNRNREYCKEYFSLKEEEKNSNFS